MHTTNDFISKLMTSFRACFLLIICMLLLSCKTIDLKQVADSFEQIQKPLDEKTVIAGLKQALEVSTINTVTQTSQKGGFSDNPLIRIPLPKQLQNIASTLNKFGFGQYAKQLELQINRSAELASSQAKAVFIDSISRMSLRDGWQILNGKQDAATEYFRQDTEQQLAQKFQPIITRSMNEVGFYNDYKKLLNVYNTLPLTNKPNLNIENYIMQQTLDGLFSLVAIEEAKIRQNPSARVTELLRRVFQ